MQGIRDRVGALRVLVHKVFRVLKTELGGSLKIPAQMRSRMKYFSRFIPTVFHGKRSHLALDTAVLRGLDMPLDSHAVFYEAFHGQGVSCNPEAIFRYLINSDGHVHLHHYWSLRDGNAGAAVRKEFAENPRVTFIETGSGQYFEQLERSKYLINNSTFPPRFIKREQQVYLNTWHGTPLKRMVYDIPDGAYGASNILKNMLASDFLLSQNTHMSQVMYRGAFGLEDLYRGTIIEDGYPRTDRQFLTKNQLGELTETLREVGIVLGTGKVILYAPTWRGTDLNNPTNDVDRLVREVSQIKEGLAGENVQVLLRVHQFLYPLAAARTELHGLIIPNDVPANLCLGIADHLITDFSSIFFDFLSLDRPIHFYVPDIGDYGRSRGLYFGLDDLPGGVSQTIDELVADIHRSLENSPYGAGSVISKANFTAFDDGRVTERIVRYIFDGQAVPTNRQPVIDTDKKSMLMFPGGFLPNGITASALNFLSQVDYDSYKVLVFLKPDAQREFVEQIDPRAQVYFEPGSIVRNRKEINQWSRYESLGGDTGVDLAASVLPPFQREAQRLFAGSAFDAALDFDGYSGHWSRVLGSTCGAVKAIWQHSDLVADSNRNVNGEFPHKKNLALVFRSYGLFDRLVSVSEPLSVINAEKLRQFAPAEKFAYVENFVDERAILTKARGAQGTRRNQSVIEPLVGDLAQDVSNIRALYSGEELSRELDRQAVCAEFADSGSVTFSFMGRLSSEKGLDLLLESFALVTEQFEKVRLLIIGDGPERQRLAALSQQLGIASKVVFTGHQQFGLALVDRSDCFVMSSHHEGQPMVLLEAQTLGKPIVSSTFPAIDGALRHGNGLVTSRDKHSLAKGLIEYLNGNVTHHGFSARQYNANARKQLGEVLDPTNLKEKANV